MSDPIRFGGFTPVMTPVRAPAAAVSGGFAERLGTALASGIQQVGTALGRQVVQVATAGLPPVLSTLAQGAASALTGGALGGEDQEKLKLIDATRQFLMMNAIFDAANAPIVERDLE